MLYYRAMPVTMVVSSVAEEIELRVWCGVKSLAVHTKKLLPLGCEDSLCAGAAYQPPGGSPISAVLLEGPASARRLANTFLNSEASGDGEAVKAHVCNLHIVAPTPALSQPLPHKGFFPKMGGVGVAVCTFQTSRPS